jgi:hypothetical protein
MGTRDRPRHANHHGQSNQRHENDRDGGQTQTIHNTSQPANTHDTTHKLQTTNQINK